MKIACYYPWVYLRSGIERTILEMCRRSRHEYTIFTNNFEPDNTYPEFRNLRITELSNVPVERELRSVLRAATVIAFQRVDFSSFDALVVHCEGLGDLILHRRPPLPSVCFCHTPLRPVFDPEYRRRVLEQYSGVKGVLFKTFSAGFRRLDQRMWSRYSHVFFNSNETCARADRGGLLKAVGNRHEVLHPGIDVAELQPTWCFEKYFLIPGRIMWTKNIELAISAFIKLKNAAPNVADFRLVIAGMVDKKSQPYLQMLRRLCGGRTDIEIVISPSDATLHRLYAGCYTVLFPAFNEDWGLVPLEANAFGKPVIASDRGGPIESQRHGATGLLLEPAVEEFAQAMALLAASPELVDKMGRQGRANAELYDWSSFVRRMDDVLETVASGETVARPTYPLIAKYCGSLGEKPEEIFNKQR